MQRCWKNQVSAHLFMAIVLPTTWWATSTTLIGDQLDSPEAKRKTQRPNIVFILADDMGFSDLGCYGGEIETPNLDALAANGLRYTKFYNTARCWPTRAALLTGYYAQQVGRDALPAVRGGARGKRPGWAKLLPEYLKPFGYRNYHSGKWHIDGKVLAAGFDRSLDMRNQGNFFSPQGNNLDDQPIAVPNDMKDYYATTAVIDHALECLTDHEQEDSTQPFFHYIAFIAPHFPLHAKPDDIAPYRYRYLQGWDEMRRERFKRQSVLSLPAELSPLEEHVGPPYHFPDAFKKLGAGELNRPLAWSSLDATQQYFQATKMAIHAAMVDRMDREMGRYIDHLKRTGQFENTLILFASDNGASAEIMVRHGGHDPSAPMGSAKSYLCLGPGFSSACNTPFRRHKTWVHEGGIATPLVVSWPAGIAAKGELRRTPAHVIDFVPTILELLGGADDKTLGGDHKRPAWPGRSLLDSFSADVLVDRDCLWWLHEGHRALRKGDWKAVAAKGDPWELYDLSSDRSEVHNLADKHPETLRQMVDRWEAMTDEFTSLARRNAK